MSDNDLLDLATKWGIHPMPGREYEYNLLGFARAVMAAEREACAKVCEAHSADAWDHEGGALACADRIRARSNALADAGREAG